MIKKFFVMSPYGWIFVIRGFTISYAHFPEALGIGWTRQIEFGSHRWWLTEAWHIWAKKDKKGFRYALRSQ